MLKKLNISIHYLASQVYGGDILGVLDVVHQLQDRLTAELREVSLVQQRAVLATELFQNILLVANNLVKRQLSWEDLPAASRVASANKLLEELQKAAQLMARNLEQGQSRLFEQTTETIQASIRITNGISSDEFYYEVKQNGNSVKIPLSGLNENLNPVLILQFRDLHQILSTEKYLSSTIFSINVIGDLENIPIELTFAHDNMAVSAPSVEPACKVWETHSWAERGDDGCQLISTNSSHSTCSCHSPGTIALISQLGTPGGGEDGKGDKMHEELGFLLGILLPVITGVFLTLLLILLTMRMSWKTRVGKDGNGTGGFHVFCVCKREGDEEEEEGDYYPDLNSSPTSTTLSDGTTLQQDVRSQDTDTKQDQHSNLYTKDMNPLNNKMTDQPALFTAPQGDQHHHQPSVFKIYQGNQGTLFRPTSANQEAVHYLPYNIDQQQPVYRVLDHQPDVGLYHPTELYHTNQPGSTAFQQQRAVVQQVGGGGLLQNPEDHYFRPVSPNAHIYMEIGKQSYKI